MAEAAGVTSRLQNIIDTPEGPSPIVVPAARPTQGSPVARAKPVARWSTSPRQAPQQPRSATPSEDENGSDDSRISQIQHPDPPRRTNVPISRSPSQMSEDESLRRSTSSLAEEELSPPPAKRRVIRSPVAARAPVRRAVPQASRNRPAKARSERRTGSAPRRGGDGPIDIKVQRFVGHEEDDDRDEEPIPFSNETGETVVDVLMHLCEETVERTRDMFDQRVEEAPDSDTRKEYRTMSRAVESFRQELESRLLQHVSLSIN